MEQKSQNSNSERPFAVINPAFPGWERDFEICFENMGFKGLRLFPTYHGYNLSDNWYFDIARMQGRHDNPGPVEVVVRAIDEFGVEKILYGSNAPFQYIKSSLLKVQSPSIAEKDRTLILSGNAMRLLNK